MTALVAIPVLLVIGYVAAEIKLHRDGYGGPDWGDDV